MPLLLELFSGTGSVGRAFAEAGWEVLSLDGDVSSGADVRCDILQWDPPEGLVPDHLHASPPCTEYSLAKTTGVRNLELADAIVQKTLAILELLRARNPRLTFSMENPWTGMLKGREFMSEFNSHLKVVNYCKYGLKYKKTTAVWTNLAHWEPRPLCTKASPCPGLVDGRHELTAQRGTKRDLKTGICRGGSCSRDTLYAIPPELCREWAVAATAQLTSSSRLEVHREAPT